MPNFVAKLTDEEYSTLRNGSMRGKFTYEFERNGSKVKFKVPRREVYVFANELQALIDSGETSWKDFFEIE